MRGIKAKAMGFVMRRLARFLKILPVDAQAVIKSGIEPVGKMDFKDGDILMVFDSKTQIYKSKACKDEPETVKWIKDNIKKGDVFYDIGANVGAFSLIAWFVSDKNCKVYAIEPAFSTFAALCRNILLNGADRQIVPINAALGSKTELADLYYTSILPGKCQHAIGSPKNSNRGNFMPQAKLAVPCYRLDDFIRTLRLPQPNYLKIDVDGIESAILNGAEETLKNPALKSILVEVNADEAGIDGLLAQHGFAAAEFINGNKIYDRK